MPWHHACSCDEVVLHERGEKGCLHQTVCMWCGKPMPLTGWYFLEYPKALCSEKCSTAFKAAF
jgi:hypothetical protein